MKINFRKIASIAASAVMLSSTFGLAAAASYPAPFVESGVANSVIVVGANAPLDMAAALDVQTSLNSKITGEGTTVVGGDKWLVETSSDKLELNESIKEIETYIGEDELALLSDGTINNEKGTATYEQFLYFEDAVSSGVTYQEDDNENVGLFFKITSGKVIARYVMDFTSNLKSDITSNSLDDIKDEDITMLGKTYAITTATNGSSGVELILMSGSAKGTVANGEEVTVGGKTVSVLVTATNEARFTVDGQTTNKLAEGETYKLDDGTYIGVSDITYQNFQGGLMQATFYAGADKLELKNGSSLSVNGETISDAAVVITSTESAGDISVSQISINMTAEDDLYVPAGGKLSESENLDEPQVLFSQNWDIVFGDLADTTYEIVDLSKSTDSKIKLTFENYNGDDIELPLLYTDSTVKGVHGGDKAGYNLVLNATGNIKKNNYFILNTADPTTVTNNARSFVVQYKGADKATDTNPKMKFNIVGVDNSREETLSTTGTASMKLGGTTFSFVNTTNAAVDDCDIRLSGAGNYPHLQDVHNNGTISNYIRTKYNGLINITDTYENSSIAGAFGNASSWIITLTLDDTNRDGDKYALNGQRVFAVTYTNNSDSELATSVSQSADGSWISDPDDNTKSSYQTYYGAKIDYSNPSSAPASIVTQIPESYANPLVYVTSGDVTIGSGGTGTGGQVMIVQDNQIASYSGKNLVVVGGSCINSVAAEILTGSKTPACEGAFTTASGGVGAGKYLIKTVASPYNAERVAMLVAGYEAAETKLAVAKALEGVTTDAGTSKIYPEVTA
ncbi:MAG: hypothetical protein WC438_00905 [Candidatus Pacearchaeota archaeon]